MVTRINSEWPFIVCEGLLEFSSTESSDVKPSGPWNTEQTVFLGHYRNSNEPLMKISAPLFEWLFLIYNGEN